MLDVVIILGLAALSAVVGASVAVLAECGRRFRLLWLAVLFYFVSMATVYLCAAALFLKLISIWIS